jgi:NNP family nitrate/nitrite transporter-like MFS transporter
VALSLGSGSYPAKYKGLAMGIAGAGNSGTVLAMLFAPPLAMRYGWKAVYGLAAIPMLTALLLLLIFAKEPADQQHQEKKSLGDYLKILFNRDVWVFNIIYAVTFGGFIGLSSFLPIFFFDHYHIPKQSVGQYSAVVVMMASILRVVGGWLADKVGGLRLLYVLSATILVTLSLAATLPANPWVMVAILAVTFSAMGAGNGALFQLVPLRFKSSTTVASSFIGEVGALAGGALPVIMGISKQRTGSFAPGFITGIILSLTVLTLLILMTRAWTSSWVGAGGKALPDSH